jgi:hypothetical protein
MDAAQATEPAADAPQPAPLPPPPPARLVRLKVLTLGDTLAGKSCLVKRYCEGRFVARYIATIGVDYGVRRVGGGGSSGGGAVDLRLNFFDTSGVPCYADVRAEFLREAHVALLVFDVSARGGLDGLARWLAELRADAAAAAPPPSPRVLVVGNKVGAAAARSGRLAGYLRTTLRPDSRPSADAAAAPVRAVPRASAGGPAASRARRGRTRLVRAAWPAVSGGGACALGAPTARGAVRVSLA